MKTYFVPFLPIARVLEAIVVPKGSAALWDSWTVRPWPEWRSPRDPAFELTVLRSVQQSGILRPLLLWDYAVVRGGTRLRAAKRAGLTTVPALLSLSDEIEPPEGAYDLNYQVAHPRVLGHGPDMIVWKAGGPIYLEYPKWVPAS